MNYELRPPERINLADQGDDGTGRSHLSHSALGTFLACEQKFNWHYEHRLKPAVTATALSLGRAFAHALETGDPGAGARAIFDEAQAQVDLAAGSPWIQSPDPEKTATDATVVQEASRAYLNRYGHHDQTREIELRARIRNPASGGRYSQTHDLLARVDAVSPDWLDLFEDKLVGQIPRKDLGSRLRLDRQVSIETYLIWRTTGVMVERVHYRLTLKPAIRQRQNETHDGYLERIGEEYATRPEHYLHEEPVTRTQDDFLRLEQELWRWAEQVRSARRDGVWPRNVAHCSDFGGCAFLALCAREPGADHQFVTREERPAQEAA